MNKAKESKLSSGFFLLLFSEQGLLYVIYCNVCLGTL